MIISVNEFNKEFDSVQFDSFSIIASPSDLLKAAAAALSPVYAFPHTKLFTGLECPCQASCPNPTSLSVISPLGGLVSWPHPLFQSQPSADGTDRHDLWWERLAPSEQQGVCVRVSAGGDRSGLGGF